ncbi:EAL domain-containing protein [uncultured Ferrimonas sp.]|uniref:EAL domain-containing protein n=1 Tax=uncultured Ferrimonas sp. TaxID=432640 RepID=UPI00260C417E|nr:EAL domain-containing protein [uncultured Ferrimonas sp.]
MKRNREQSQRLILFWGVSLLFIAISIMISVLSASFAGVANARYSGVESLLSLVEVQLEQDPHADNISAWLPNTLASVEAQRFRLVKDDELLLGWFNNNVHLGSTVTFNRPLAGGYEVVMVIPTPNLFDYYSWQEWLSVLIGLGAALAMVGYGRHWLAQELQGIELLAQQGARINQGDYHAAIDHSKGMRPLSAARAYRTLHQLWRDERQAKLELDRQVRTNAFLDKESGLGNRLYFDRHLLAMSEAGALQTNGVICLLQFVGLEELPVETRLPLLQQFIELTKPLLVEHNKAVFARLHWLQLGLVIPGLPLKEAESLAERLHRLGERLQLPASVDRENFLDIGVTYFCRDEPSEQALDEAELALRAAQLQGQSNWFMYDKGVVDRELAQGTVRWRSIIESALANGRLQTHYQTLYDGSGKVVKREQFSQLLDNQDKVLPASLYLPMAQRCGLLPRIERDLLAKALHQMQSHGWTKPLVVNLSAESVMHPRFGKSVAMLLANYQVRRTQLVVEINERELVCHGEKMANVLRELRKIGVQLAVDGVGYTVEHTRYIEDFSVDWLKLHPSLVRHIQRRPESQLVVTSLIQAAAHQKLRIIAEGVEDQGEWDCLLQLGVEVGQGRFFLK